MSVNNTTLYWTILDGGMDGIKLCSWMKISYESAAKLNPLKIFYGENIWLIKLKVNGLLVNYVDCFQGLEILQREIDMNSKPEDELVTQMVQQIEDPLLSGTCKIIKNWDKAKSSFHDVAAMMRAHKISKMTDQTKRGIQEEVNRLLLGKDSNKRRATGEVKMLC